MLNSSSSSQHGRTFPKTSWRIPKRRGHIVGKDMVDGGDDSVPDVSGREFGKEFADVEDGDFDMAGEDMDDEDFLGEEFNNMNEDEDGFANTFGVNNEGSDLFDSFDEDIFGSFDEDIFDSFDEDIFDLHDENRREALHPRQHYTMQELRDIEENHTYYIRGKNGEKVEMKNSGWNKAWFWCNMSCQKLKKKDEFPGGNSGEAREGSGKGSSGGSLANFNKEWYEKTGATLFNQDQYRRTPAWLRACKECLDLLFIPNHPRGMVCIECDETRGHGLFPKEFLRKDWPVWTPEHLTTIGTGDHGFLKRNNKETLASDPCAMSNPFDLFANQSHKEAWQAAGEAPKQACESPVCFYCISDSFGTGESTFTTPERALRYKGQTFPHADFLSELELYTLWDIFEPNKIDPKSWEDKRGLDSVSSNRFTDDITQGLPEHIVKQFNSNWPEKLTELFHAFLRDDRKKKFGFIFGRPYEGPRPKQPKSKTTLKLNSKNYGNDGTLNKDGANKENVVEDGCDHDANVEDGCDHDANVEDGCDHEEVEIKIRSRKRRRKGRETDPTEKSDLKSAEQIAHTVKQNEPYHFMSAKDKAALNKAKREKILDKQKTKRLKRREAKKLRRANHAKKSDVANPKASAGGVASGSHRGSSALSESKTSSANASGNPGGPPKAYVGASKHEKVGLKMISNKDEKNPNTVPLGAPKNPITVPLGAPKNPNTVPLGSTTNLNRSIPHGATPAASINPNNFVATMNPSHNPSHVALTGNPKNIPATSFSSNIPGTGFSSRHSGFSSTVFKKKFSSPIRRGRFRNSDEFDTTETESKSSTNSNSNIKANNDIFVDKPVEKKSIPKPSTGKPSSSQISHPSFPLGRPSKPPDSFEGATKDRKGNIFVNKNTTSTSRSRGREGIRKRDRSRSESESSGRVIRPRRNRKRDCSRSRKRDRSRSRSSSSRSRSSSSRIPRPQSRRPLRGSGFTKNPEGRPNGGRGDGHRRDSRNRSRRLDSRERGRRRSYNSRDSKRRRRNRTYSSGNDRSNSPVITAAGTKGATGKTAEIDTGPTDSSTVVTTDQGGRINLRPNVVFNGPPTSTRQYPGITSSTNTSQVIVESNSRIVPTKAQHPPIPTKARPSIVPTIPSKACPPTPNSFPAPNAGEDVRDDEDKDVQRTTEQSEDDKNHEDSPGKQTGDNLFNANSGFDDFLENGNLNGILDDNPYDGDADLLVDLLGPACSVCGVALQKNMVKTTRNGYYVDDPFTTLKCKDCVLF